jgi:hypothetical protein
VAALTDRSVGPNENTTRTPGPLSNYPGEYDDLDGDAAIRRWTTVALNEVRDRFRCLEIGIPTELVT